MTKIDIFSGFLGAGKTTLIKKLISEAYTGEKLVLVENEFGEIGIDGGFMQDAGINVTEMNSGCICCSLTGDFRTALEQVCEKYAPDRILIEPSGVGKLSDVVAAVESCQGELTINALVTVVDAAKVKVYRKNFGEFYDNQIESAGCIVLSRTAGMNQDKLDKALSLIRALNATAVLITTPWDALDGKQILAAMEQRDTLAAALSAMEDHHEEACDDPDCPCHHREDECDDPDCTCHHHDHEDEEHEHHHHGECRCEHDHHEHEHEHQHHHDHEEHDYHHHEHEHHHHHGHDADEVFVSWGMETAHPFSAQDLESKLQALNNSEIYGMVLRAKGIVDGGNGQWIHFDFTPGEIDIRNGSAAVTGRVCVIGSQLCEKAVAELFS